MGTEIERKFLLRDIGPDAGWRAGSQQRLSQGYLSSSGTSVVRVRVAGLGVAREHLIDSDSESGDGDRGDSDRGDKAWLTVKGPTVGATRAEYEYEIPAEEAAEMLETLCEGVVDKTRFVIVHRGKTWEVDEFSGANQGLVVAEIELESEDESFESPTWVGAEVTGDVRYYNSNLSREPFRSWPTS